MNQNNAVLAYVAAIAGGVLLWIVVATASGGSEAWDAPIYWTTAYPGTIILAGILGYLVPHRAWRWGLTAMWVQGVMAVLGGAGLNLFPLAMIMLSILSIPPVVAALLGGWLRRRISGRSA